MRVTCHCRNSWQIGPTHISVRLIFNHHVETPKRVGDNTIMLNGSFRQCTGKRPLEIYTIASGAAIISTRPAQEKEDSLISHELHINAMSRLATASLDEIEKRAEVLPISNEVKFFHCKFRACVVNGSKHWIKRTRWEDCAWVYRWFVKW